MNDKVKEKIACLIIEMIWNRFIDIPFFDSKDNPSVFQDSFIKNFNLSNEQSSSETPDKLNNVIQTFYLSKIADIVFFERTAQILCDGEKRKFKNLTINTTQQSAVNEIISSLKNNNSKPNLIRENELIFSELGKASNSIPNFDADVYYEDGNNIVIIEIKTVKPNSGIFKVEKEKILLAKAALKNLHPKKNVYYYLAFPFDPLNKEKYGYDKERFFSYSIDFKKFFDSDEVLLADEFWNFLSGEKETMQDILAIINYISTPDFMTKYNFINDSNNLISDEKIYKELLQQWFLKKELQVVDNRKTLLELSQKDKKIIKLLNQNLFDTEGKYKEDRINSLIQSLTIA